MTKDFDVAIVGGGPAGLMAGLTLARGKVNALVVEKSYNIGEPIHTSGGSWIKEMETLQVPSSLYNPIKNAVFISNNSRAEFRMNQAEACILKTRELLQHLAVEAIKNGCDILLGARATSIENESDGVRVRYTKDGEPTTLLTKYAIDSSGFSAVASRSRENELSRGNYGYGMEYEAWIENLERDTIYLMFGSNYAQSGYGWIFPIDNNKARIGSGFLKATTNGNPKKLVDKMITDNQKIRSEFGKIVPIETHSGVVPASGTVDRSIIGRIILAGDSAGQVTPHIGEGIRFALKYGQLAGRSIIDVLNNPKEVDAKRSLQSYESEWKSDIEKKFQKALRIQALFSRMRDEEWDRAVHSLNSISSEELIAFLRGDFSKKYLISLFVKHPTLFRSLIF